jgi:hypothetical protein
MGRPPYAPAAKSLTAAAMEPELLLAGAILRRVLADARLCRGDIRAEAIRFIQGDGAVWWDDALGMHGRLVRLLRQTLDEEGEAC